MRRAIGRGVAGAALAAVALIVAGCSQLPAGADGDMINSWPAPVAPVGWTPAAPSCHNTFHESLYLSSYQPLDCTEQHYYETVHVGEFTGELAAATSPPASGASQGRQQAWADCDKRITKHLGGEWRNGKVWIGVSLPSKEAWEGGARWYRCEVAALNTAYGDPIGRTDSLAGEFKGSSDLKFGCFQYGSYLRAISCKKPHNAEFVGVYKTRVKFSRLDGMKDELATACRKLVAKHVGVPVDGNLSARSGVVWNWPSEAEWNAGDRAVRCHLWLDEKRVSRSLAGAGTSGLPINYA